MELVAKHNIPFCFFTNGGGGLTEAEYIAKLNDKLRQVDLEECFPGSGYGKSMGSTQPTFPKFADEQIVLAYSPFNATSVDTVDAAALALKDKTVPVQEYLAFYTQNMPFT